MLQNEELINKISYASKYIDSQLGCIPDICITLGSGLSSLADLVESRKEIKYDRIPGFPKTTVEGHEGALITGRIKDVSVLMMKGRFHYYEGHSIEDVVFPIRVFAESGIKTIILTNAAGGVNRNYVPGELMAITDHIGMFCESPLRGLNLDKFGPRFPDQSSVYDWEEVVNSANKIDVKIHKGVYCYAKGPMYETPAEIRMLAALGADAVGMSTVPEAITASHCGMKVMGISTITNFAAGILDTPLSHKEVIEVGVKASESLKKLVLSIIESKGKNR